MSNPHPPQHGTTRPPVSKRVGRMARHVAGTKDAPWGRRIAAIFAISVVTALSYAAGWNGYGIQLDVAWPLLGALTIGLLGILLATLTANRALGFVGVALAVGAAIYIASNRALLGGVDSLVGLVITLIIFAIVIAFVIWLLPSGTTFPEGRTPKVRKRKDDGWDVGSNAPATTPSPANPPAPATSPASQPSPTPPPASA